MIPLILQNLGEVLLPLPPINGPNSVLPDSNTTSPDRPSRDFSFELAQRLEESEPVANTPLTASLPSSFPQIDVGNIEQPQVSEADAKALMDACREVEGFLLSMLLKSMSDSLTGDKLFSSTYESSVYNDMFFYELANSIGKDGPGLGIAQTLYDDIIMKTSGSILHGNLEA